MAAMSDELYYIQNNGFVGNCLLWWRKNNAGYTCNIDEALKVSYEEAMRICKTRPKEDIPHPASVVEAAAQRHVTNLKTK